MCRGFSKIDIVLLIITIIFLVFVYNKFSKEKIEEVEIKNEIVTDDINKINETNKADTSIVDSERDNLNLGEYKSVREKNLRGVSLKDTIKKEEPIEIVKKSKSLFSTDNGYYKNSTYNYEITCIPSWPLRIRTEENISIGTVPPKNGTGAITIEVEKESKDRVKDFKNEAQKHIGMVSVKEEKITVSGVVGTKLIVSVPLLGFRDVFIILNKNNYDYIIKYSEESSDFVKDVENAIRTFKFL